MNQEEPDFQSLCLPIANELKNYSPDLQQEIFEYLSGLDDINRKGYIIAFEHLGSSFNIARSNGFKQWKAAK